MGNNKISDNDAIDAALQLDGDPDNIREFYEDWAENYETDTRSQEYRGPATSVGILKKHLAPGEFRILDAGCGTGFVGIELLRAGYAKCDGFDLSPAMVELAVETGCYDEVRGDIDIMRAAEIYPLDHFDAILSVGVFTLGHVPPEALEILLRLVRPGGILLVSTRTHYYDQTNFEQFVDGLLAGGGCELIEVLKNAPYNNDGDAHYWVFKKSA